MKQREGVKQREVANPESNHFRLEGGQCGRNLKGYKRL